MPSQNPFPVAVVGTGLIGPCHAQSVISNTSTTLACIEAPNPAAAKVASDLGVPPYPSIQAMVSYRDEPVAAIVCTPNRTHVAMSTELLDAEIYIECEKPLSIDPTSDSALVRHAEQLNLHLLTGHHRRFNPFVKAAQRFVASSLSTPFKPPA